MTTTTLPVAPATPSLPRRLGAVLRVLFANPWTTIGTPSLILAAIFVMNYAIWLLILRSTPESEHPKIVEGFQYSGASMYIFVYMLVVAVQAMNGAFAFALGLGSTRRDFYLGSAVAFVGLSAMYATGLTLIASVETATGGWGVGGRMFTAVFYGDGPLERFAVFFVAFLFFFFAGAAIATVYVRWRALGITIFFVGAGFTVLGIIALLVLTESGPAVGAYVERAGLVGTYATSLIVSAIAAVAGYLNLRRATVRN